MDWLPHVWPSGQLASPHLFGQLLVGVGWPFLTNAQIWFPSSVVLPPALTHSLTHRGLWPGRVGAGFGLGPGRVSTLPAEGGQFSYSTHGAKCFGMWATPRSVTWFRWRHVFEVAGQLHTTLLGMVKCMLLWPLRKHDSYRNFAYNEHDSYAIFVYNEHDCEHERSISCIWVNQGFFGVASNPS